MLPFILPCNKTKQNICQQSRPYLLAHRILVVTHEVGELKSLFDLLEENFNGSACLIEVTNETCRPSEIVGNENHAFGLSVDFDDCLDQTQSFRIPDILIFWVKSISYIMCRLLSIFHMLWDGCVIFP